MARRARYSSRAELRGGLGIEDAPGGRSFDVYRFLTGRAHGGRHGAARLALRGDGLPAGALAVEYGAESARGDVGGGAARPARRPPLRQSPDRRLPTSHDRLGGSVAPAGREHARRAPDGQRSLPRDRRPRREQDRRRNLHLGEGGLRGRATMALGPAQEPVVIGSGLSLPLHRRAGHTRPRPLARGNSLTSYASPRLP